MRQGVLAGFGQAGGERQQGEKQADKDIAEGNTVGPFGNIKDALKALKTAKT